MDDLHHFSCPYCAQPNSAYIDISAGKEQDWITDCEVCCRPLVIKVRLNGARLERFSVRKENE